MSSLLLDLVFYACIYGIAYVGFMAIRNLVNDRIKQRESEKRGDDLD